MLFISCSESKPVRENKSKKDAETDQYIRDSIANKEPNQEDYKKFQKEYIKNYSKISIIDTVFKTTDHKTIKIYSKYHCLFDSAFTVPERYNWWDTSKSFTTYNYADNIVIVCDTDTIFNKTITKWDFSDSLGEELRKYGVIYDGVNFAGYNEAKGCFKFSYSISIPITDVGTSVSLIIDKKGKSNISLR
jgi:hypothetical protein